MKPLLSKLPFFCLLAFLCACDSNPGKNKKEKIEYVMKQAYENGEFVGNVLVSDSGKIIYEKSFGKSDAEKGVLNTDSTKFLIASLSKPITSIIMLRLRERGLITLEDPIKKFFAIRDPDVGKITIHHLMTHSSGINEFISKEKITDFSTLLNKAKIEFEPGSSFQYSNAGFILLIKLAEKITSQTYSQLVTSEVFEPARMRSSGVARNDQKAIFAKGYTDVSQRQEAIVDYPFENVDGAGSLYSTTEDLYKLDVALRTTTLLSEESISLMLKQQIPEKYGYGWFIRERGGSWDVYWHKGDLAGITTFFSRRTTKNQAIILLGNAGQLGVADLENSISKILKVVD